MTQRRFDYHTLWKGIVSGLTNLGYTQNRRIEKRKQFLARTVSGLTGSTVRSGQASFNGLLALLLTNLGGSSVSALRLSRLQLLEGIYDELTAVEVIAPFAPVQWSPTDVSPYITVSGANNTIATRNNTAGAAFVYVRSDTSQSSGIRYVEFTVLVGETSGNNFMLLGVANGKTIGAEVGASTDSAGYWSIGATLYNGGFSGHQPPSAAAYGTGDVIGMVVDMDAHTVKWNKNGGAFGTTQDITAFGADVFVAASINNDTPFNSVQLNGY